MKNEVVFILGGGSGMGLATAAVLTQNGYQVVISGRTETTLDRVSKRLGPNCTYALVDASDAERLKRTLLGIGKIDHIVVTISVRANAGGIHNTSEANAKKAFQRFWISYNVLHLSSEVLQRNGSVTLISGSSAKTPLKGYGVWGSLHGSLNALVKQAAIDLAPIRVNAISPGGIGMNPDRQLTEHNGTTENVAQMIYAVVGNAAVTATVIDVDGGERMGTWNG